MSRFTPINMASLPTPDVIKSLGFEAELASLKERLLRRAEDYGLDLSEVVNLETDPLNVLLEVFAEKVTKLEGEANDDIGALLLADAIGPQLDHIGATYYGVGRLTVTPADPAAVPPVPEVKESDEDFQARIALAPEAFSTAGPEGAYIFHVLELDGTRDVSDVAVYSEDDNATYTAGLHADAHTAGMRAAAFGNRATGDPVIAPEVLIVILPTEAYGAADQALLDRAYVAASRKDVRPIGDTVRIEPATATPYQIEANLLFDGSAAPEVVIAEALAAVTAYTTSRRRIGARVQRVGIAAAMKVPGVEEIDLIHPAADILPGSKGYGQLTGEPVITAEVLQEGWRP